MPRVMRRMPGLADAVFAKPVPTLVNVAGLALAFVVFQIPPFAATGKLRTAM